MVRRLVGTALLLPLAAAMGCETTQPTAKSATPAQVYFRSVADAVPLYEVWDASMVTVRTYPDQPGRPPDQTVENLGLWCDLNNEIPNPKLTRPSANYPLRFSVQIERIRAGSSAPELITEASYGESYASVTPFDDAAPEVPASHPVDWSVDLSDPSTPNTTVVLSLKNGRRISAASRDYVEKEKVPAGTHGSVCPSPTTAQQLPLPGVAGSPGFFAIDVNAGDTIVVKSRKDDNPLRTALFLQGTTFESQFWLEGRNISTSVTGNTFSPSASQDGISYAFTLR